MESYIWINPSRLPKGETNTSVDGIDLVVELSPYDIPKAITGRYDEPEGCFEIAFEYIDEEPQTFSESPHGIRVAQGKHSGKLLGVSIPVDHPPLDETAIIQLRTNVLDALDGIEKARTRGRMNRTVAKGLLSEDLDKLAEVLVATD